MEINRDIVRWLLLLALLPIGWPFVKALWQDFNEALREEGGMFGATPSPREVARIREEKERQPETLVSEPWVKAGDVRKPRLRARSENKAGDARRGAPGQNGGTPRRFR